jgi:putative methionine-R-sulfoxide reductase with GAF domain
MHRDRVVGVLDLDSSHLGRFDRDDSVGLNSLTALLLAASELCWIGI